MRCRPSISFSESFHSSSSYFPKSFSTNIAIIALYQLHYVGINRDTYLFKKWQTNLLFKGVLYFVETVTVMSQGQLNK